MFIAWPTYTIKRWASLCGLNWESGFLREIYRGMLDTPQFLGFVYEEAGQIEGFIAGSKETSEMMHRVFLSRGHRLALAGVLGLRNPTVLKTHHGDPFLLCPKQCPKQ